MPEIQALPEHPIGIFDSGLGGLTVLKSLKELLPDEQFIYLGDTARTPYGTKTRNTIVRYARECANFLLRRKIKLLVVACNTASSYALKTLIAECSCPVIGTIDHAANMAVAKTRSGCVGVIGTEATIASKAYEECLETLMPDLSILSKACPLFVPLVEQGMVEGEIVDKVVELYLSTLKSEAIDTLLLGCTHFPLLDGAITKFLGQQIEVLSCAPPIAAAVKQILHDRSLLRKQSGAGSDSYYVTDEVNRFKYLAKLFLAAESVEAIRVRGLGD